jgi:LPXTG-site transpeptidase (sortase) family protein
MSHRPLQPIPIRSKGRARSRRVGCIVVVLPGLIAALLLVLGSVLLFAPAAPTPTPQSLVTASAAPSLAPTHHIYPQRILSIPALNLTRAIVETQFDVKTNGWDISTLEQSVGHLYGTAPLGSGGNAAIIGHITLPDNTPGPFLDLSRLAPGDLIYVQKDDHRYTYAVEQARIVAPDDLSVLAPTTQTTLTLLTCTGWDVASQRYTERLVVVAYLVTVE